MISDKEVLKEAGIARVDAQVIEKDYVLSWLLVAIAESDLRGELVFEGGTALKKVYYEEYRFSEDLDFTLRQDLPHDDLVEGFKAILPSLRQRVDLDLQLHSAAKSASRSTKLEVSYLGPLLVKLRRRRLNIDFTRGELLLDEPVEGLLCAPYSDYPTYVALPTYTIQEILTEKLCALMGRSQPRDLYDVYWIFEFGRVDTTFLAHNFGRKCQHKGHDPTRLEGVLRLRQATFERLWKDGLAHQIVDLPHFNEVMRLVRRHLRALELA